MTVKQSSWGFCDELNQIKLSYVFDTDALCWSSDVTATQDSNQNSIFIYWGISSTVNRSCKTFSYR